MKLKNVAHWDDERDIGNSLIVTLVKGYRFDYPDISHTQGFDTVSEAKAAVKSAKPCQCKECNAR